jgi:hypothetical protein
MAVGDLSRTHMSEATLSRCMCWAAWLKETFSIQLLNLSCTCAERRVYRKRGVRRLRDEASDSCLLGCIVHGIF